MSKKTKEIIEKLKCLTLLEAARLVSEIEETFRVDVKASAGGIIVIPTMEGGAAAPAREERKTTFDVVLESVAEDKRVATLKVIRRLTNLGLKEAKDFCCSLPKAVKEGVSKEDAEIAKKELEAVGGCVVINLEENEL